VLIFPDFNDNFELAEDLHAAFRCRPSRKCSSGRPGTILISEPRWPLSRQAGHDVTGAARAVSASLSFDYVYGIDAAQFAVNGPGGVSNLGSSAAATVNIPIWNWGPTQSRIKRLS